MPTAADMAQLGFEIVAGHQSRRQGIAGIFTAAHELAAQTGEFVGGLQQTSRARKQETKEHARQTAGFLFEVHMGTLARQAAVQEHAAQTGEFTEGLQRGTRARKRENAQGMRQLRKEDKARQAAVQEQAREVGAQLAGIASEMKGARQAWREQLASKAKTSTRGSAKSAEKTPPRLAKRARRRRP